MRKTKIICTIGPSTNSYDMIYDMCMAGMNVARLNMSHGSHKEHGDIIKNIKSVNQIIKQPVPILIDTQGPEIRTGDLKNDFLQLNEGDTITVHVCAGDVAEDIVNINYQDLINNVEEGGMITVDNGLINLQVLKKNPDSMECKVIDGGTLKSKRHVNLPGIRVNLPSITEKDKHDIQFAMQMDVDYIALSFVREASDVLELHNILGEDSGIKVISKIEEQQGLKNIEEIIDVSDGIMVARGDLGIEIDIEDLPNVQRMIVRKCQEKGKRVIVATHMLESMIENPMPTRAEATDVANAVYEEADAVMLSGETSVGKHPVRCINYLDRIARASEKFPGLNFSENLIKTDQKQHVAATAVGMAEAINARGLVVITKRGVMAQYVTNRRPNTITAYALTEDEKVRRQLSLNRNVYSNLTRFDNDPEVTVQNALNVLKREEGFEPGDTVVIVSDVISVTDIDAIQIRQIH